MHARKVIFEWEVEYQMTKLPNGWLQFEMCCSIRDTAGTFKENWGSFKSKYFLFHALLLATEAGVLKQTSRDFRPCLWQLKETMMFSKPFPWDFVPNPNQSISTAVWREENRTFYQNKTSLHDNLQHNETYSLNICVVLQKFTWLPFNLAIGLKYIQSNVISGI